MKNYRDQDSCANCQYVYVNCGDCEDSEMWYYCQFIQRHPGYKIEDHVIVNSGEIIDWISKYEVNPCSICDNYERKMNE